MGKHIKSTQINVRAAKPLIYDKYVCHVLCCIYGFFLIGLILHTRSTHKTAVKKQIISKLTQCCEVAVFLFPVLIWEAQRMVFQNTLNNYRYFTGIHVWKESPYSGSYVHINVVMARYPILHVYEILIKYLN